MSDASPVKQQYLLVKGGAGFGNRVFCLIEAIHYAEKTKRKIVIDWNDGMYFPKRNNYFDDYFTLNDTSYISLSSQDISCEFFGTESVYPKEFKPDISRQMDAVYVQVRNSLINQLAAKLRLRGKFREHWMLLKYYKGKNHLGLFAFLNSIIKSSSYPLGGYLKTSIKADIVVFSDYTPAFREQLFKDRFRFKDSLIKQLQAHPLYTEIASSIGIHVRHTDLKPSRNITDLIAHLKKVYPDEKIFLATDSSIIEKLFTENFQHVLIVDKNLTGQEVAIHKAARDTSDQERLKRDFERSLTDLYFLSQCKVFFYQGNSSFSILAKAMSQTKSFDWLKTNFE